jgi:hypothetical protein
LDGVDEVVAIVFLLLVLGGRTMQPLYGTVSAVEIASGS